MITLYVVVFEWKRLHYSRFYLTEHRLKKAEGEFRSRSREREKK